MKVVVGYDGSFDAAVALADLHRAGLPEDTELRIVTVRNTAWEPPSSMYELVESAAGAPNRSPESDAPMPQRFALARAHETAAEAVGRMHLECPRWKVRSEALEGEPAAQLARRADEWGADLIVVGSRGRTILRPLLLGSVSRKVLGAARRSVRVARQALGREGDATVRILVGVDGSPGSEHAVREVAARKWPEGSEARVVAADGGDETASSAGAGLVRAAGELAAAGLDVSLSIRRGGAAGVLREEARDWGADCIFVGSRSFSNAFERMLLGSVSTALVENAPCSLEVVRPAGVRDLNLES